MKRKHDLWDFLIWAIKAFFILLALSAVAFAVVVYVKYGNLPITEVPAWAVPFFMGGK